jgi:hypothetical protein
MMQTVRLTRHVFSMGDLGFRPCSGPPDPPVPDPIIELAGVDAGPTPNYRSGHLSSDTYGYRWSMGCFIVGTRYPTGGYTHVPFVQMPCTPPRGKDSRWAWDCSIEQARDGGTRTARQSRVTRCGRRGLEEPLSLRVAMASQRLTATTKADRLLPPGGLCGGIGLAPGPPPSHRLRAEVPPARSVIRTLPLH